jgi:hypothetical protein
MASLEELPAELIVEIAGHVEHVADLVALRETCSRIYHETADVFAQRVQSIPWLINVDALSALERVAGNNAVAGKLQALRVGSKYIHLSQEPRPETQLTTASASEQERQRQLLRYCLLQRVLDASNTAVRSLESVFRRLPQLEHVEVTDGDTIDHDVAKKFNMYPERRCPGMGKFERMTGKTYNSKAGPYWSWDLLRSAGLPNMENGLGYNFELVLKALAAAQKPIKSLRAWHE